MRELQYPAYDAYPPPRVSWGAIFAGAFISLAAFASLSLLGAGIGLISVPAAESARGLAVGMGAGGAIWLLLSGIVSFYLGGWTAGRLAATGKVSDSVLHGVVSWSAATLAVLFLAAVTVGGAAGGVLGVMGSAMGAAGKVGAEAASEDQLAGQLRQAAEELQARAERLPEDAPAQAAEAAETAAQAAGAVGLFAFFCALFNAGAAALGARAGTRLLRPAPVESYRRRETPAVR